MRKKAIRLYVPEEIHELVQPSTAGERGGAVTAEDALARVLAHARTP